MLPQLKKMPDYSQLTIGHLESYKGSVQQSPERAVKHDHVAALYNHVRRISTPLHPLRILPLGLPHHLFVGTCRSDALLTFFT